MSFRGDNRLANFATQAGWNKNFDFSTSRAHYSTLFRFSESIFDALSDDYLFARHRTVLTAKACWEKHEFDVKAFAKRDDARLRRRIFHPGSRIPRGR